MNSDTQLNQRQIRGLRLMRDAHRNGAIERNIKRVKNVALGIAVLSVIASPVIIFVPSIAAWLLGFCTGLTVAIIGRMQTRLRDWPVVSAITDWKVVDQLIDSERKE